MLVEVRERAKRPRDRRAQLLNQAVLLFWERGFDGVTVAEIAAAVGVTAGAVYKHVPDKDTLLADPIREMVLVWYASTQAARNGAASPRDALERMVESVVEVAVDRPEVVGLWHREGRHLPGPVREELAALRSRSVADWVVTLTAVCPELDAAAAEFRIRAALGLLNSTAFFGKAGSRPRLQVLLAGLMTCVLLAPVDGVAVPDGTRHQQGSLSGSRREDLLTTSARLFRERGYHRVGMDDIGEAAGMRGPSVYGYFDGKADVLFELLIRMADRLDVPLDGALADTEPRAAVEHLLSRYTELCMGSRDLVAVYATELHHLPPAQRNAVIRRQRSRARRWTTLLRTARPELSEQVARITVLASLEMIFSVVRSRRWPTDPTTARATTALALAAMLGAAGHPSR